MALFYVLAVLSAFATLYSFGLPQIKHRPAIVTDKYLTATLCLYLFTVAAYFQPWLAVGAILIVLALRARRTWIVLGVNREDTMSALSRAAAATRANAVADSSGYRIGETNRITILGAGKAHLILFRLKKDDKKAWLTREIFRKYLSNYFLPNKVV